MSEINYKNITILPAPQCKRSKKIIEFLDFKNINYEKIDLTSSEGQALSEKYHFLASPGILINGASINPYDVLDLEKCQVDPLKALGVFS